MTKLVPFSEDASSHQIAGLTVENGTTQIAVYGSLNITKDKAGLAQALALQSLLNDVIQSLHAAAPLPDAVARPEPPGRASNPFA